MAASDSKSQDLNFDRIIVLGHKGFIGSSLTKCLAKKVPKVEIVGVDLPEIDLTSESDVNRLAEHFNKDSAAILLSAVKRQFGDTMEAFKKI